MPVAGLESIDGRWLDSVEFLETAFALLSAIKAEPSGRDEMLRLSTPRAKKMSEEILPLAAYARSLRERGQKLELRWLGGNQAYDAEVRGEGPEIPKYLEATIAVPDNEYLVREHISEKGFAWAAAGTSRGPATKQVESKPRAGEHSESQGELEFLVRQAIAKKVQKDYPTDTSLIVQFRLDRCLLRDEFDEIVAALQATPADPAQKVREVIVIEPFEYRAAKL